MKTVVIIGAGPAGLTAGYELLKSSGDFQVVILEESSAIGGISRTVRHNGNRMDIGGHRFFSKDERVMDWWKSMLPLQGSHSLDDKLLGRVKPLADVGPDPESEDRVMLMRQRVSRIYYLKKFFDYPISLKWQTIRNLGFFMTMKAGFSYLRSMLFKKPDDSLENFYVNRFGRVLYSMFFEGYTEKVWGRHPSSISADWGAQRVKGLSVVAILKDMFSKVFGSKKKKRQVETSLIEDFIYPKLGPGQLWETAADEFVKLGGTIVMNASVVGVRSESGRVTSVDYVLDGEKRSMEGDVFLSSMPLRDLVAAMEDEVPPAAAEAASGLPYRDFMTVGLLVNRLNLVNQTKIPTLNQIVPDCWIYVQDAGVRLGRIQIFNNWSPYMVKDPQNTVWIGLEYFCDEGDDYWTMNAEDFVSFAIRELVDMGIVRSAGDVLDSHLEYVKKAYPAYFDTYDEIDSVIAYVNSFENLYCIGRNGQHRYNNMDHSMATAFEAVSNIMSGREDKSNVWNVNTEKSYHEKTAAE